MGRGGAECKVEAILKAHQVGKCVRAVTFLAADRRVCERQFPGRADGYVCILRHSIL